LIKNSLFNNPSQGSSLYLKKAAALRQAKSCQEQQTKPA